MFKVVYNKIVVEYIAKEFDLDKENLNLATSLSDIGLDGDDVYDFLIEFFKTFDIEYEGTNYIDFVPAEGGFMLSTILSLFNSSKKIDKNEITIKDLVTSLENKKWTKIFLTV